MFINRKIQAHRNSGQKAQSTVEYIVLVTAVIAVVILFANSNEHGLRKKLNDVYQNSAQDIDERSTRLAETHEGVNQATAEAASALNVPTVGARVNPTLNVFN